MWPTMRANTLNWRWWLYTVSHNSTLVPHWQTTTRRSRDDVLQIHWLTGYDCSGSGGWIAHAPNRRNTAHTFSCCKQTVVVVVALCLQSVSSIRQQQLIYIQQTHDARVKLLIKQKLRKSRLLLGTLRHYHSRNNIATILLAPQQCATFKDSRVFVHSHRAFTDFVR